MGFDLFKRKCGAHNLVLGRREPCPRCTEKRRERVLEADAKREAILTDPELVASMRVRAGLPVPSPLFGWECVGYHPSECHHRKHYDVASAVCRGCGLSAEELVAQGYARVRRGRA